jgi:aromatic ring hydroxylase
MSGQREARTPPNATALRTGAEFLRSLDDGRQIFIDGERVGKVVEHLAFRGAARSIARLFDIAAASEMRERMTFLSPRTGAPVWRAWQVPHTHADLKAKRLFSETWAEASYGLMGRTPDHVAGFFTGFAAVPDVFATGGQNFADNVVRFYEYLRDNHLYVTYAIVPPQIDRSKPAHQQSDHVFIYRNVAISRDQWWKTPAHLYGNHQAQCRYATKLRFMIGLAKRMNQITGNDSHPAVGIQMGELAALVTLVDSMLQAHEVTATIDAKGVLWPSQVTLYAVMSMQSELNGRMLEIIRELAGAAMITLPSSARDFDNPDMAQDIKRYMQSASADARTRVATLRMAWDFLGTEFGNRHAQYEKFYGGASFVVKQSLNRFYDYKRATNMVDSALQLPPLDRP